MLMLILEKFFIAEQIGVDYMLVFINKVYEAGKEIIELVEMKSEELLASTGFDADNMPIICLSALCALDRKKSRNWC